MNAVKLTLYVLAIFTSFACTVLLFRAYAKRGVQLLLWSAFCFVGLTVNNVLLFCDAVVFPSIDLRLPRLLSALAGLSCLLYAFIWNSDRKGNP
jgi:hypothetical protein